MKIMSSDNSLIQRLKIQDVGCVGDMEHNKYIDVLTNNILDSNISHLILSQFKGEYKTGNWIFTQMTKEELRKLNTIMKTKNFDTLCKKMDNYLNYLQRGTIYSIMFKSLTISAFKDLFRKVKEMKKIEEYK